MTRTDVMGPIEAELRAQRDFLARSDVEWVWRTPTRPSTACMVVRCEGSAFGPQCLSLKAAAWLGGWMGRSPVYWNDYEATSKEQVVAKLDEAIAAAREAGR